ncbi:nitrate- and nitrite sensing domain-containing protein [Saccharomonospora halophila]|uniref:nitrate- and nitrite sensing domain-containing protein n=1 Tax=Saccharomonospora halophila TaxID=129922 RepID=UPI00048D35E0|nr:nitrate- and nitrite sensing domain-containing protein [Saccharomonospora halophila]
MSKEDNPSDGRQKSIRKRLTGTVLVPSVALLVMWTVVSVYFVADAIYVRTVASSVQEVSIPAVTTLSAVHEERRLSLVYLAEPEAELSELQQRQREIDSTLSELREAMDSVRGLVPDEIAARMSRLEAGLDELSRVRAEVHLRTISAEEVDNFYNEVTDTAADLFDAQARVVPDVTATQGALGATDLFRVSDKMSRAASLASGALARGAFGESEHLRFSQLIGSYRSGLEEQAPYLRGTATETYNGLTSASSWQRLHNAENALIGQGPGPIELSGGTRIGANEWRQLTEDVSQRLATLTVQQADTVSTQALNDANGNLRNVILGSVAALLAAVASIVVAVRVSRTLVDRTLMTRLERLRGDALELAKTRLPTIVRRLGNGEHVDVDAEMPRLDHGRDEIGQVAEAFNIAQRTAVNATVSEAKARAGVNNVFLGIAHRTQGLVHRQLRILDRMESREENSEQLTGLFQLDNLATRARRTTENLIILGGKHPGRRWRKPVALVDVLRAAVSETEDFSRIEVDEVPDVSLIGSAVADSIHLVAELADNATSFSPPGSPVQITSTVVARGVVVDVSDRGLGMKDDVREWANRMMSEPPEFDAMALRADSSLGLFVVARLASRLGVLVTFDSSRYGGTRATALIPTDILAGGDGPNGGDSPDSTEAHVADRSGVPAATPTSPDQAGDPPRQTQPTEPGTVMNTESDAPHNGGSSPHPTAPQAPRMTVTAKPVVPTDTGETPETAAAAETAAPASPTAPSGPGTPTASGTTPRPGREPGPDPSATRNRPARRPLPQRQPQQNLVDQLRDDPEEDTPDFEAVSGRTRSTLSAFRKGTRRGRESGQPKNESDTD